jgi:AAA+ superfamily predicted ATPase/type IV secretory pathway TrbD component
LPLDEGKAAALILQDNRMTTSPHLPWPLMNQRYLQAELLRVQRLVEAQFPPPETSPPPPSRGQGPVEGALTEAEQAAHLAALWDPLSDQPPPALESLCAQLGLSRFERDLVLLCAGVQLSRSFYALCARACSSPVAPTFELALAVLPGASFGAVLSSGALRRGRLLTLLDGPTLAQSPLQLEERVLQHLLGVSVLTPQLARRLRPLVPPDALLPSQQPVGQALVRGLLSELEPGEGAPRELLWLTGPDAAARRQVAAWACAEVGLPLWQLRAAEVPTTVAERDELLALWAREQQLEPAVLALAIEDPDQAETARAAVALVEQALGPVLILSREVTRSGERAILRLELPTLSFGEQAALLRQALLASAEASGDASEPALPSEPLLTEAIEQAAAAFRLDSQSLQLAATDAWRKLPSEPLAGALWQACRQQARPKLDDLMVRIDSQVTLDDLILPEAARQTLQALIAQKRHQATVYQHWGLAQRGGRGLGLSALFVGQSGTGKTLAAEAVASALQLDLYRIDLSQVVSKYIGETEKHLRRIFDSAEQGGAVLLFDEADALFGKRSEVKDSHDRHANIEVSYLLQRMEAYQGVSILTSNLRSALDSAFLRRLRFVLQFPFPDRRERVALWRLALPETVPQQGLDLEKLARLSIAGGHIRNIALAAAFLAAAEQQPVFMRHLLRAAREEYAKLERPLSEQELAGWL